MKIKEFLRKTQNQPENIRKIIFWVLIIIIGLSLFIFWLSLFKTKAQFFKDKNFLEDINFLPDIKVDSSAESDFLRGTIEDLSDISFSEKELMVLEKIVIYNIENEKFNEEELKIMEELAMDSGRTDFSEKELMIIEKLTKNMENIEFDEEEIEIIEQLVKKIEIRQED